MKRVCAHHSPFMLTLWSRLFCFWSVCNPRTPPPLPSGDTEHTVFTVSIMVCSGSKGKISSQSYFPSAIFKVETEMFENSIQREGAGCQTNLMHILPYSDVGCTLWSVSRARTELRSNNNMKRKGAAQFACFVLSKAAAAAAAAAGCGEGLLCL